MTTAIARRRAPRFVRHSWGRVVATLATLVWSGAATALTISSPTAFASLDGSASDGDATVNGVLTVSGNLVLSGTGSIENNDPASPPNNSAGAIKLTVSGSMTLAAGTGVLCENRTSGGSGGALSITVGGNLVISGSSGSTPGAILSSSRTTTGGSGNGGDLTITVGGGIDLQSGSIVSAANLGGGKAGDIRITAGGSLEIAGLVSSGPSTGVLASKLDGFVLDGGNTTQRGGKIIVRSNGGTESMPRVTVSSTGILVSQGQDPASDSIQVQACGVLIRGLVASVAKKSNGSPGNSPVVSLLSGRALDVEGQNLGGEGTRRGCVRADYVIGEAHIDNVVDLLARDAVHLSGSSTFYCVRAFGGSATNQDAGTVNVMSLREGITTAGKAIMANATTGGGKGGNAVLDAHGNLELGSASIQCKGANSGGGHQAGGQILGRSFNGSVSGIAGGELNADGGGGKATPTPGIVTLQGALGVAYAGTSIPAFTNPGAPGSGPTLAAGISLPSCDSTPVPVLLTLFVAEPMDDGIAVRWRFQDRADVWRLRIERGLDAAGPWSALEAPVDDQADVSSLLDRDAEPARTYWYRLIAAAHDGEMSAFGPISATFGTAQFALSPVRPNPAFGPARLEFAVPRESDVRLAVYDVRGRRVATLAHGRLGAGRHVVTWSGRGDDFSPSPAGVYFARLETAQRTLVQRLVLLR